MKILVSDVGGTNTRFALVETRRGKLVAGHPLVFPSQELATFEEGLDRYLSETKVKFDRAAFAVAAPVQGGQAKLTNLPWTIHEGKLRNHLGKEAVFLLNDLEAQAYGLGDLKTEELARLRAGVSDPEGSFALIAPGTGLGKAAVLRKGGDYQVIRSEGGHCSFGAQDALELQLLEFLLPGHTHVSWERVLSGPGIFRLYRFLRQRSAEPDSPWLQEALKSGDPTAAVSQAALENRDAVAVETLQWFNRLLARAAGDMALEVFATGGVFLGGGIPKRIMKFLDSPEFEQGFLRKGRMEGLLTGIPVNVVLAGNLGLMGAARYAELSARRSVVINLPEETTA